MEKMEGQHWYDRFVDEAKLASIHNRRITSRYAEKNAWISVLSFLSGFLFLTTDFERIFDDWLPRIWFGLGCLSFLAALLVFLSLARLEKEHRIFKKRRWFYLFYSICFFIQVITALASFFVGRQDYTDEENFPVISHGHLFLLFFLAFFGYVFFSYYAFGECYVHFAVKIKGLALEAPRKPAPKVERRDPVLLWDSPFDWPLP